MKCFGGFFAVAALGLAVADDVKAEVMATGFVETGSYKAPLEPGSKYISSFPVRETVADIAACERLGQVLSGPNKSNHNTRVVLACVDESGQVSGFVCGYGSCTPAAP